MRGLNLLLKNNIKVRFKTMALRSNFKELSKIADFCRKKSKDYFRFDPFLHLRIDGDNKRNSQIKSERLTSEQIVAIEREDSERRGALEKNCDKLINPKFAHIGCNHIFHCGAGTSSFTVSYDGFFWICSTLNHPSCIYDLKKGSLSDAWNNFVPRVRNMRSDRQEFLEKCRTCSIINLCMWCPANAYLETGQLDKPISYFCEVARARAESLGRPNDKE